ncbi:MAG: YggT family protein [Pseudomonadales bacterium]
MFADFSGAAVFLIHSIASIYFYILLVRFLAQVAKADFYNPITQTVVRLTDPAIKPLRTVLPTVFGVDLATLATALLVQLLALALMGLLEGRMVFHITYVAWVLLGIFAAILNVYFFGLIVLAIASWIAPYSNHPALTLIYQITEPVCIPARKILPPMGGLDFSLLIVLLGISVIDNYLVVQPLAQMLSVPRGLIPGL